MAVDLPSNYDFTLTIDGKDYGFMLYTDPQTQQKRMGEGLAPLMTPQQRVTEFSYEHIPPEIDVPAAFENWGYGAGMTEYTISNQFNGFTSVTSNAPRAYAYSVGVDLSWPNRAYVSPARQDESIVPVSGATTPQAYWYSTYFGYWAMAGTNLYKYDLIAASWIRKDTASGNFISLAELNGVLYAAVAGAAYHYSIDGVTWTTATLGGGLTSDIVEQFVTRGNVLWAQVNEALYNTTNGQNGGVNWSAAVNVGSTSETTQSMVTVNNDIWLFKKEGAWVYNGTSVSQVYTPKYISTTNGKFAYVHSDGNIYVVYEDSILGIDPFNSTSTPIRVVYPVGMDHANISHLNSVMLGTISQITGDIQYLYFHVTSSDGGIKLMKFDPTTQVAHTIASIPSALQNGPQNGVASGCFVVGPGVAHTENPCLTVGYTGYYTNDLLVTTAAPMSFHYILPRSNMRPEDDDNYRYDLLPVPVPGVPVASFPTVANVVYGPWMSFGARAFSKFLNRGTLLTLNTSAGQYITLSYELDNDGTIVDVLTATQPGSSEENISSTVPFNRVRYKITMKATTDVQSPILVAATLHATLNPPRRSVWRPVIELKTNAQLLDGSIDQYDPENVREVLFSAVEKRLTLTDRHAVSHIVRLLDIQEQQIKSTKEGQQNRDSQVYQLYIAQITAGSNHRLSAIYGADAYGAGKVYS